MQGYINTLPKEVAATDIRIVQLKLGMFDFGAALAPMRRALVSTARDVVRETSARAKIVREDAAAAAAARVGPAVEGSPLRELHVAVFDAIVRERGRSGTIFVGRGSRTYDFISRWVPAGVVGWMLKGVRNNEEQQQQRRGERLGTDDEKITVDRNGSSVEWDEVEREMGASAGGNASED